MRLLIVDDHTQLRRTIRSILARDSNEVRDAVDGDVVVESFVEFRPNWKIMDLQMPLLDGQEATRRIFGWIPTPRW